MKIINVTVKDKRAYNESDTVIVCGNSDYEVEFAFDEEWAEYEAKTAVFTYGKTQTMIPFNGNRVNVPILTRVNSVEVGVFAGDLHTTTNATIECKQSALCKGGLPADPLPDVYNQIIALINAGMLKGEQGEKGDKGDKGDAGSIKFIIVAELPTENIDESAIYMIPKADSEVPNLYEEYIYANGEWEIIGSAKVEVDLTDYVKKTDYVKGTFQSTPAEISAGVVKPIAYGHGGIDVSTVHAGGLRIIKALYSLIDDRTPSDYFDGGTNGQNYCCPITPANLDYAVISVLSNYKGDALTDEQKAKAQALLGITDLINALRTELGLDTI